MILGTDCEKNESKWNGLDNEEFSIKCDLADMIAKQLI